MRYGRLDKRPDHNPCASSAVVAGWLLYQRSIAPTEDLRLCLRADLHISFSKVRWIVVLAATEALASVAATAASPRKAKLNDLAGGSEVLAGEPG
jgi:hypothetical protein